MFSFEFCEISKNTFLQRTPLVVASAVTSNFIQINLKNSVLEILEKCPNTEFFLVSIFPHSYLSVFSTNAGNYRPEKNSVFGYFSRSEREGTKKIHKTFCKLYDEKSYQPI